MRWLLCITLCFFVGAFVVAGEDPIKLKPKPEDFLGKWSGKWDNKWQVHFTITQDPKTKQLNVLYQWEEKVGKPLREQRLTGKIEGNRFRIGQGTTEITISAKDPDKGKAVGNFKIRRTADLVREKEKDR